MLEKMLVTQALDERDLLVKKITDKIRNAKLVDTRKRNEEKTIANICRHLRNSIAHCHFKAYSSDGTRIIDRIVFNDYVKEEVKDEQSFQYDTKVTDFRFFFRETRG